jgi:hypothetical protein
VMGAGGGDAAAPARATKPTPDRARTDEPKREPGKPDEGTPATARLQPPSEEQKRPGDVPGAVQERGRKPAAGRPEPATASRGQQRPEPEVKPPEPPQEAHEAPHAVAPNPAPVAAAPESTSEPSQNASAPANTESGEGAPVPRDNIPD